MTTTGQTPGIIVGFLVEEAMAERAVSDDELKEWARARGYGEIAEVLHAATVMYVGWEMDNEAWLVRMADGSLQLFKTSHGGLYPMELEELDEKIAETDDSLRSLRRLREPFGPHVEIVRIEDAYVVRDR